MAQEDVDVIVVGGGPVGMGLAIELGQRGISTLVIEKHELPQPIPKGQNLTQRSMEHFSSWRCEAELRAARTIPSEYGIGGVTTYRELLGAYQYDWLQRERVRPFYFTDNERLPQYATEKVLRDRVAQLKPVRVLYGWSAEGLTDAGFKVSVTAADLAKGVRETFRGRYLVGCDGSRSMVRRQAGITQSSTDHDRLMVLLVFRSEGLHRLLERYHPGKSFYNVLDPALNGYWKFFGRSDCNGTFFFHAPVPHSAQKEEYDFTAYLHEAAGADFDIEFEHVGYWDLRIASAESYRAGSVFIAGDAAHSHPPYGGYGINSGFEDARNLGWKLAAVLQGWAGPGLLDSYDSERRPVFRSTARDFIEKSIEQDREFLRKFDPQRDSAAFEGAWAARAVAARREVASFAPHYRGSTIVWGKKGTDCSAVGEHQYHAEAGTHLAPARLSSGRSVHELSGEAFTLLALGPHVDHVAEFECAAKFLGVPFSILRDPGSDQTARYHAGLVLIRPDGFVAWSADELEISAHRILRRVVGHNSGPD